jgi:sugar lactone lactonase YvrE
MKLTDNLRLMCILMAFAIGLTACGKTEHVNSSTAIENMQSRVAAVGNSQSGVPQVGSSQSVVASVGAATPKILNWDLLAGSVDGGYVDGAGAVARFFNPGGITTDSTGNVYVADYSNKAIRKITPSGATTTVARKSKLDSVRAIAVDGSGDVFALVGNDNAIYKVTPAGSVTTFAGKEGVNGNVDGVGSAARFNRLNSIATDSSGNVYVSDTEEQTIRKITPSGMVTTFAGQKGVRGSADGSGTAASFDEPQGLVTDGAGNVYVADNYNNAIRKITPDGVVTTLAGKSGVDGFGRDDGIGAMAKLAGPSYIAIDGVGNLYVSEASQQTIRKITPSGVVTTLKSDTSGLIRIEQAVAAFGTSLYNLMGNEVIVTKIVQ